jgi:drug/metabolite transporter (DMT)-like permease
LATNGDRSAGADSGRARAPWWAYACLAASMAIVGVYVALSKALVALFPVLLLAWLRFAIAALAMLGWLRRRPGEAPLGRRERVLLFWESVFGNFLFSICMLYGVALTSAVAAGIVMAAIPAAVALLSRVFLGERLTRRAAAGIACGTAAVVLLALAAPPTVTGATAGAPRAAGLGTLLLAGATLCEAIYVVIGKRLAGSVPARRISALVNLWGLALTTPFGAWLALSFDFRAVPWSAWAGLAAYAIAASMATVWLWMRGQQHVPASTAGVYTVLLPVSAAAVGVLVLGEPFGALHIAAFALTVGGLLLATRA